MKERVILMLATVFLLLNGCDKNNNNIDSVYQNALEVIYPNVKYVEWKNDNSHMTAEFRNDGMDVKVWFDNNGSWLRIETDMSFKKIPQSIQNAFKSSDYAHWRINDIVYLQIKRFYDEEMISCYEFHVEQGGKNMKFAIYSDGTIADSPYLKNF